MTDVQELWHAEKEDTHTGEKLASEYLRLVAFLKGGIVCSSAGFGNVGPLGGGADCTLFGICCGLGVAPDELGVADGGGGDACWELAAGTKVGGGPTPCGGGGNGGRIPGPGGRNGGAPGGSIPGGGMPGKPGGIGNPGGGGL